MPVGFIWAVALFAGLIVACGQSGEGPLDPVRIAYGSDLYQEHCASCHGEDLSGHPDWRTPDEDGFFRPPPHDSSGHTWHHADRVLMEIIRNGGELPQSRMPAFGNKLSDDDIEAILDFFKDNWGEQERAYQELVTEQDQGQ